MQRHEKSPAFYDAFLAPMELIWFSRWRKRMLSGLKGEVLDIGSGTGVNLRYYPESVDCVTVLDPNETNIRYLLRKSSGSGWGSDRCLKTKIGVGEKLPFRSGKFDAVVSTLILCTVEEPEKVVSEAVRVLRRGGKLVLIEHQLPRLAPQKFLFKTLAPIWRAPSGCNLNRYTARMIKKRKDLNTLTEEFRGPILGFPFYLGVYEKK